MRRRELLQLLAVAVPALSSLSADQRAALGQDLSSRENRRRYFDPHHFAITDQLSEIIIPVTDTPGAHAAGVAAFIERMVAEWYGDSDRAAFLVGLNDVDARSVKVSGRQFVDAPAAMQMQVVEELEASLASTGTDGFWARFKALTLYGFYNSQPGVQDVLKTPFMPGFYDGDAPVGGATGSKG